MAGAKMLGRAAAIAAFQRVAPAVTADVGAQLDTEVGELVAAIRRAAPVDAEGVKPGELRDSVHAYPTPNRPLSFRILADAKDSKTGQFIGSHVEAGHRTPEGKHVAATPFFFPTYRARKKGMRRRLSARGKAAAQRFFSE